MPENVQSGLGSRAIEVSKGKEEKNGRWWRRRRKMTKEELAEETMTLEEEGKYLMSMSNQ
jgi:hypothetical protein